MSSEDEQKQQEALKKDQEEKKQLIIETVTSCFEKSDDEDLQAVTEALKNGDKLVCKILSGGVTNYSYKVYLEGSPETAFFAKVCFAYALWNPDRNAVYDLVRTENEFKIMKDFAEMMGDEEEPPVAKAYFCVDVPGDAKILVTQWSKADEQIGNQYIDGEVDDRIIPKVADALATLNLQPVKPDWNEKVRPCMASLMEVGRAIITEKIASPEADDATVRILRDIGQEGFDEMMDAINDEYENCREVLCHNDAHSFNILVEKKPDVHQLEKFGPKGNFVLCDWEMSFAGFPGRDAGLFQAFPLLCIHCHAVQGHRLEAYNLLQSNIDFWEEYEKVLREKGGKDDEYIKRAYIGSLAILWTYAFTTWYLLGIWAHLVPLEGVPESEKELAKAVSGATCLKLLAVPYRGAMKDASLDELKAFYKETVTEAIESLLAVTAKRRPRPRRASVLRAMGRRVSDAMLMDEHARRASSVLMPVMEVVLDE